MPMNSRHEPEEAYFSAREEFQEDLAEDLPFAPEDLQLLASGGFGTVLTCSHKLKQVPLVVKITELKESDEDEGLWDAFETESDFYEQNIGRSISWLPAYYGSGFVNYCGVISPWIALEHLYGCLLALSLKGEAANQYQHLALGAFNALEGLHAEGYVHRDVKPENFAVRKDALSGKLEVCLIDFGLLMSYHAVEPEGQIDKLCYIGTLEYSSDRHLQERMVGPADDLESLGYTLLELFMGESWRDWREFNRKKQRNLMKFAEENQALILPTRHRNKRGREAQHAQQGPELPLVSENNRPRHKARGLKEPEDQKEENQEPVFEARIVLAPPSSAALAAAAAVTAAPNQDAAPAVSATANNNVEPSQKPAMPLRDQCLLMIERRNKVWAQLDKQGKIPDFLKEYMSYCKSLSAYECPDYKKLRAILQKAPKVAHIAQALHAKHVALQKED